ncbi:MAG: DUF6134 family protein [Paracoccaceae bacterium]
MNRRDLLTTSFCAFSVGIIPSVGRADGAARRSFKILRDGSDIGRHTLSARRTADAFEIRIEIDIAVKFLGITAYRYELENTERWQGGQILSIDSRANDDGDREYVKISRGGDALEIDGSGYSGSGPLGAATTSYYAKPFLERRPWISTQSGKLLEISTAREATGRYQVTGELTTELFYDDRGEWMGSEFDAGGERARYEVLEDVGQIAALWADA